MDSIPYSAYPDDPLRQFDFYLPELPHLTHVPPLICFIHGGAWKSEDKRDHAQLARSLATATRCPVAVPNYRLTPRDNQDPSFRHPIHAEDILAFLVFVRKWRNQESAPFDPDSLVLLGHSCSAHMLSAIFLGSDQASLNPAQDLLRAVKGIVMSEGIYDLDALIARFPAYHQWFIEPTFGPSESYERFSALRYPLRPSSEISWLLLHSKGDTLIDLDQTRAMHSHLTQIAPLAVSINTEDLKEEHDDIFTSDTYLKIVSQFISKFM
ncbi:hypothetical protein CVT25_000075 [Psilocybe cyanescens]|uniref:BD-FAE-like domain-containing protein n=1 Tax=Psilocybe cyanescens TaxID=93625 RepID=A0A409VWV9_PSICY|nr:hypothetical protein CVT25_000075 [Psilocybe cyanescens]